MIVDKIKVIDVDTHIIEPYNLWTSRLPRKYGSAVPHVRWNQDKQLDAWYFGENYVAPAAVAAMAGHGEYPPIWPSRLSDTKDYTWSAKKRLEQMDHCGIHAQLLYPNVGGFGAGRYLSMNDRDLMLDCIQVYNDWLVEWSAIAPDRFIPLMTLPFWDIEATVKEMERSAKNGHKGIVACAEPDFFGLPKLTERHWDPMWAAAQDMRLPVNFHIGSGADWAMNLISPSAGPHASFGAIGAMFFIQNAAALLQVTFGGICHRFPDLNFVSVESGVGWLPYMLEAMDWQWKNSGVAQEHPEYKLLPSEYFRRQIFGCFWFERDSLEMTLKLLGPDNLLFETDFPHPTSMSPGPASIAQRPADYIEERFANIDAVAAEKMLHGNAARIYNLG